MQILKEHLDSCYKGGDGKYKVVARYGAQWSNWQKTGSMSFTRDSKKGCEIFTWQMWF